MDVPNESSMQASPPRRIREIEDYQKIAAGEVIERPASVVKELIENSIDAGATIITINIQNVGKTLIQVIDDGCGIHPEDVKIAFLPHTSNKIRSAKELNSLLSLGFRGEALYSISSISKVELITKTHSDPYGIKIEIDGGVIKSFGQTAAVPGTLIKIRDLFYNTPVRYKFLKSDRVELGHITDIVSRYVIAYPQINFKLVHDNKPILSSPSSADPLNAIFDVYGKDYAKNCVKFSHQHSLFTIEGYLGDPKLAQSTSHSSSIFINHRYVVSPIVHEAMKFGYKDYIMIHKHPFYVMYLTINPAKVDFNIHPTKKIVRFEEEEVMLAALREVMRAMVNTYFGKTSTTGQLGQSVTSPGKTIEQYLQEQSEGQNTSTTSPHVGSIPATPVISSIPSGSLSKKPTTTSKPKRSFVRTTNVPLELVVPNLIAPNRKYTMRNEWIYTQAFPKMRLISESGQLHNLYFVFEGMDGYYILDMHAADERINFEKEQKAYQKGGMQKQRLIVPFTMDVPANMKDFLLETIEDLGKFGFEVTHLGGKTFTLHTIPAILKQVKDPKILTDVCLEIIQMGKEYSYSRSVDTIIKYIACHESIRGGDLITDPDRPRKLLIELAQCENPHHCAHGRPTMLFFSWQYLEKEFHR